MWKILYPKHFFLTRGNHETVNMTSIYGFKGEVQHKYDGAVYDMFMQTFNEIPLGVVLGKKILVVHGGIPKQEGATIADIQKVNRRQQPPGEGLFCDLVWADPQEQNGFSPSPRGVSQRFGPDITKNSLGRTNLNI
eukprot:UN29346